MARGGDSIVTELIGLWWKPLGLSCPVRKHSNYSTSSWQMVLCSICARRLGTSVCSTVISAFDKVMLPVADYYLKRSLKWQSPIFPGDVEVGALRLKWHFSFLLLSAIDKLYFHH
jgi:hypothetical protein